MSKKYISLALLPLLTCCPSPNTDDDDFVSNDDDLVVDDDDSAILVDDDDSAVGDDDDDTVEDGLFPVGPDWDCFRPAQECNADYLVLADELNPGSSTDFACHDAFKEQVYQVILELPFVDYFSPDAQALREDLEAVLDMGLYSDAVADQPLDARLVATSIYQPGILEEIIIVADPLLGDIKYRLYRPENQEGPLSAVLGLPGHPFTNDEVGEFLQDNHAHEIIDAGLILLVLETRAYDGYDEELANVALTCAGSSLTAARQQEISQGINILDYLSEQNIATGRHGLIGHSGGAQAASLAVRLTDRFRAVVLDNRGSFIPSVPAGTPIEEVKIGDDTHTGFIYGSDDEEFLGLYGRSGDIHNYGAVPHFSNTSWVMDLNYNDSYVETGALDALLGELNKF